MVGSRGRRWSLILVLALLPIFIAGPVRPEEAGRISGTVLDKQTKEVLPDASVIVNGKLPVVKTDIGGKFNILSVRAGTCTLTVRMLGYIEEVLEDVLVLPDAAVSVQIEMEQRMLDLQQIEIVKEHPLGSLTKIGSIAGTVRDKRTDMVLPGVVVEIMEAPRRSQSGSSGYYLLYPVPAGACGVRFSRIGFTEVVREVQILPDETCTLDVWLDLSPAPGMGTIMGTVLDKKAKYKISDASIEVMGTAIRTRSNIDGQYILPLVPTGACSLRIISVGYTAQVIRNLHVWHDGETHVDVRLEASPILPHQFGSGKESPRLPDLSEATPRYTISKERIRAMPVTYVTDGGGWYMPWFKVRHDQFHIRGGRDDELLYIVDGVPVKDPLGGRGGTTSLNLSGTEIESVNIMTAGWPAEYGDATAGIVKVATREGDRQMTRGHVEYFTDNLGTHSLNRYSFNYDRLEFRLSGPVNLFNLLAPPVRGRRRLGEHLTYMIYADFDRSDSYTPINNYNSASTRMDYRSTKFLGITIPDRQENCGNIGVKLTCRLNPNMRMTGIFKRSRERRLAWDWRYRYTANTMPWIEDGSDRYSVNWTHNLSARTYYTVILSRFERTYEEMPGDPYIAGGRMSPDGFLFADEADHYTDANQNGQYDPPENWIDTYADGQHNNGDVWQDNDGDGVYRQGIDALLYDFNGNGQYDASGGEPFADRNGNHVWDNGDPIQQDGNGNGVYDPERERDMFGPSANDIPEPFIDGDRSRGEPFTDINKNGVWDDNYERPLGGTGEPFTDLSGDSKYQGPDDPWVPGIPFDDLNGNGVYDFGTSIPSGAYSTDSKAYGIGEPFVDLNGNGQRDSGDGFFDRGWDEDVFWHRHTSRVLTLDADITSYVNRQHELKSGFTYSAYDLTKAEVLMPYVPYEGIPDNAPHAGRGIRRDFYTQTPKTGALYLRDRMQHGQLTANIGLRYDFFIQSDNADIDLRQSGLIDEFGTSTIVSDNLHHISPRFALSYPISTMTSVFFNYGHFYQLPQLAYMYRRSTLMSAEDYALGNVNLDYMKTIQYEFGVQTTRSWLERFSLRGFYKEDDGRIGLGRPLRFWAARAGPTFYANSDFARSRGVEIELRKRYGRHLIIEATYDFSYATGKTSAQSLDLFGNISQRDDAELIKEIPVDWDQRHALTVLLDYRVLLYERPRLFGFRLPSNFRMSVFWRYGSGFPYTPGSEHPSASLEPGGTVEPNSMRLPSNSVVDVRFSKGFNFGDGHYRFEVWVNNLFDTPNVLYVDPQTGRPETSLNLGGIPYLGSVDADPRNWGPGRQVRVGIGVDF